MNAKIVLGVDGGGTKTACVALDLAGNVIGEGRSGSSNRNSVHNTVAQANLNGAIYGALKQAERQPLDVARICLGMAGIDRETDRILVTSWMATILPSVPVIVDNDAMIALASGTGGELYGVVVVSGTGMIVVGIDKAGQRRRAGGWGALLGDRGSGYAIGIAALTAVANATDGLGPPTILQEFILDHLALARPQDLIGWLYSDVAWARFAALAPLVFRAAEQGDVVAQAIIGQAADDLAATVMAVVRGLHMEQASFPLVLAGGNLQLGLLRDGLSRRLQPIVPTTQIINPAVEPAIGAALLALKQIGKSDEPT